jgi:Uma2 family endonuclease
MTLAASQSLPPRAAYTDEPIFRLSVDQYHELIRSGKLSEDDPVELIEGILVFKMPKNTPHSTAIRLLRRTIEPVLTHGWLFDSEQPITLADGEPEPDGVIVRGAIEDYADRHPGPADVALVIEVAETSLERDRGLKLRSYARAGIPAYWIVNLLERQVEVHTDPDASASPTPTYRRREVIGPAAAVSLALPAGRQPPATIPVQALLPPAPAEPREPPAAP